MMAVGSEHPMAVVTGATGGIGRWIALGLAQAGHDVVLIARDPARGAAARDWIAAQVPSARIELVMADLSLLAETRQAGVKILSQHPKIVLLVNNAGMFASRRDLTFEGHERVLATNLLSPLVLTEALLPALQAGAPSRIVMVGSSTSDRANIDPDHLELGRRWTMQRAYAQSKLALMMDTFVLAKQLAGSGVTANVVHPGLVATGLVRTGGIIGLVWRGLALFARNEEEGAGIVLHTALTPELAGVSGAYFKDRRVAAPNRLALDPVLAERVWRATHALMQRSGGTG